jgi:RNA polymerase sigma-70 factor (ECF subfamily)
LYETAAAGDDLAAFSEKDVEACCAGDDQSRRRLYDASYRLVYRMVYRMVGARDADDVTQQVYLQLFIHLKSFVGRSALKTWIYKVAMNESLQHLRRRTRRRMAVLVTDPADRGRSAQQRIDDSEALEFALSQLDPTLRSLFMLRESEGLSYAEIAEVIGVPEGTVGSRLNRARAELRGFLKDQGWGPKP